MSALDVSSSGPLSTRAAISKDRVTVGVRVRVRNRLRLGLRLGLELGIGLGN